MKKSEQDIEHSSGIGQTSLNVVGKPMENLLHMTDHGQQRESCLDNHTVIPGTFLTQLEVVRGAIGTSEAQVRQRNRLTVKLLDFIVEVLVMHIHGQPLPTHNSSQVINDPAQFEANRPAAFVLILCANLLLTAPRADRKEMLNWETIHDGEEGRLFQQPVTPRLMGSQQAQQPGSVWQATKQRRIISPQPTLESAKVPTFEREQDTDSHQFARIQSGLRMFFQAWQQVIDKTKDVDDNILCGHEFASYGFATDSLANS